MKRNQVSPNPNCVNEEWLYYLPTLNINRIWLLTRLSGLQFKFKQIVNYRLTDYVLT